MKLADAPEQTVLLAGLPVIEGGWLTVNVIEELPAQLFASVTVTVYVVVLVGEAVGLAAVGSFSPVVGVQL